MKISKATVIRTIVLIVTLANMLLVTIGKNALPFDEASITTYGDTIWQAISAVMAICASMWAWWKNNSFTKAAITADTYKDELKKGSAYGDTIQETLG